MISLYHRKTNRRHVFVAVQPVVDSVHEEAEPLVESVHQEDPLVESVPVELLVESVSVEPLVESVQDFSNSSFSSRVKLSSYSRFFINI